MKLGIYNWLFDLMNISSLSLFRLLCLSTSTVQHLEISRVQSLEISRVQSLEISRQEADLSQFYNDLRSNLRICHVQQLKCEYKFQVQVF